MAHPQPSAQPPAKERTHLCSKSFFILHLPGKCPAVAQVPGIFSEVPATAEELSKDLYYEKWEEFVTSERKKGSRRNFALSGMLRLSQPFDSARLCQPLNLFFLHVLTSLCGAFYFLSLWLLLLAAHTPEVEDN